MSSATLGFWWLPLIISAAEQQNEDRRNREQIAAQAAEQRRAERKQALQDEQAKGQQLETDYRDQMKALCQQWQALEARKKRGFNLDLLDQMDELHKAITKLKADFEAWKTRKPALSSELASLGGLATEDYTVKAGESLSSIAGKVLGSIYRWPDLAALNPEVKITQTANGIPYSDLKVGQVIRIPSKSPAQPEPSPVVPSPSSDDGNGAGFLALVALGLGGGAGYIAWRNRNHRKKGKGRKRK